MAVKLKPQEEIISKILHKNFMKEFNAGKLCASDQIRWYRDCENTMQSFYEKWLVRNRYADKVV
jgi:hypothetical protein